jgi:hypothetical protein
MRFLAVSSPHAYTTRDVWQRVVKGMRNNGADVLEFDLLPRWKMFDELFGLAIKFKVPLPATVYSNLLAYETIVGASIYHEVDAVIIVSPQYCPTPVVDTLRKAGKKTIGYFTECPYEDSSIAPMQASHFDHIFVNDRNSVELFRSFNPNVEYLSHCYDPDIHFPSDEERERVVFIGTLYPSRKKLFDAVNWTGLDFDLYGIHWLDKRYKLHRYIRGEVKENTDVADIYRRTAVGVSIHRVERYADEKPLVIDDNEAYSAGPRTWELAACETFQVSDFRPEIRDVFGDAVPFYRTPQELEGIVRKAIANPAWRRDKAKQQRAAIAGRDCTSTMETMLSRVA